MSNLPHVISLGGGRQSTAMSLIAAKGFIAPMPVAAIFADTQWEPAHVYETLKWLEKELPFPLIILTKGSIRKDNVTARVRGKKVNGDRWASLPYFTTDGTIIWDKYSQGKLKRGQVKRQCTSEYKIGVVEKYIKREILGLKPRARLPKEPVVVQWRGMSRDEVYRLTPSRNTWCKVRYPLANELLMTTADCVRWQHENGYPESKRSSCIGCPFHDNREWRDMKINRPDEFADAVDFDRAIRKAGGMRGDTFLHCSCRPLDEVDFENLEDKGQENIFNNYCETGVCFT